MPAQPSADRFNRPLAGVLLVGLLLRLAWCLHLPTTDASLAALPDQQEYLALARNLLHRGTLVMHDPRFHQDVYAYRTPGYPSFLAACGSQLTLIRCAQALLDTSTIAAVYLLARRWLSRNRSVIAATIVAINPLLIYCAGLILTETLFTTLLAWSMVAFSRRRGWAGILLAALAALVRPSELLLAPLLAVAAVWLNSRDRAAYHLWLRTTAAAAAALGVMIVVLFPWALRNERTLGAWIWTSTNTGVTLYDGFHPQATGASDQRFLARMPQLLAMTEVQRSQTLGRQAMDYAATHPLDDLRLAIRKIARTWSPVPLSDEYAGQWRYLLIGLCYTLPLFVATLLGLFSSSLPVPAKVFLLIPALYITAVHAASVGSLRYRIPADVPMAVMAAATAFGGTVAREARRSS